MVDWEDFYNSFRRPGFVPGYEIQNRLGGGAFGEVYKARKLSIGKPYAVKFLKLDDQADREAIQRELEQVRLFASIDHPNLVTIEDMGLVMDVPYLIMGYAGEETLARRLKRGELDRDAALRFFVQACRGVLALHDRRLAHFDLKPGNVFLKGDVARVGDYGLAKLLVEGRQSLSFGRGTPHYMAPEMLRNRADHRADIYSLGVILYESTAGRLPFGNGEQVGVVVRESDDPPAFPPDFPAELRGTVETCLRLSPDDRFASVNELLEDLGQTARQGDSVRLPWGIEPLGEPRRRPRPAPRPAAPSATTDPDTPTPAVPVSPGGDVVSFQRLTDAEPADSPRPGPVAVGEPTGPPARPALAGPGPGAGAPAVVAAGVGTVPVPPRDTGGVLGTAVSAVVLGAEILGALVTGPVVYLLRGIGAGVDHLVRGLPGAVGALVRLLLFMLLCMAIGAVVALLFMGGVMGGAIWQP